MNRPNTAEHRQRHEPIVIGDTETGDYARVEQGERRDAELIASEGYGGWPVKVPLSVWRARKPGPTVFLTAAVHGDELNGTGVVRQIMLDPPFDLACGSLILAPLVNVLGLERHQRYLPDRRDLNRAFPGHPQGSLARRFAHSLFNNVVRQCDYGIDLHSAAVRRTNFPNVRADLRNTRVRQFAFSLGSQIVIHGGGPRGSLRRESCRVGCPTVTVEAGEVWKIEPTVVEFGSRCVRNALIALGMVEGQRVEPHYQVRVDRTKWVRAEDGGMLQFHVAPGDLVSRNQVLATSSNLLGRDWKEVCSPVEGVVIGMTTLPAVTPGDAICHIAVPKGGIAAIRRADKGVSEKSLYERIRDDLSTSLTVSEPTEEPEAPNGTSSP